jgi:hypothetical protein
MAKDHSSLLPASNADWDKAWDVVSRLGAARKHLESNTGSVAGAAPAAEGAEHATVMLDAIRPRPPHRPLAVWILIGALWISIGMIVSAAIVTVAFLA